MQPVRVFPGILLSVLAASLAAPPASAQPAGTGNHAGGLDYQPTPAEVLPRERRLGIAPPPARERAASDEVERMNRQLQGRENADPLLHPHGAGRVDPDR